ncbi:MAG: FecR domain-containing protein [Chitinophagaceae bacterium]|nr:FecR domain-containing protein [Chitinophagaceae bacterium]
MTTNHNRLRYLLQQYQLKQITWEEMQELFAGINAGENEAAVQQYLAEVLENPASGNAHTNIDWEFMFRTITREDIVAMPPVRVRYMKQFWWAAAAIVILVGITAIWWLTGKPTPSTENAPGGMAQATILPGCEGAMLTLADGTLVSLDTIKNGAIALQGGAKATVVNGALVYERTGDGVVYNTMSTPKGRQYQLTLPDGTRVWLNAASSIHFPTVFAGKERRVQLSGEAYFEVAKDREMPFKVMARNNAEVEVLGTNFNVSAYDNEELINTTLLEGAVRITPVATTPNIAGKDVVLKPGQQARLSVTKQAPVQLIENVDPDKVMAWKKGLFNFEDESLQEIMKQLERWYDIDVVYEKDIPDIALTGKMTRGVTLNKLLPALEKMGLHYRLEGRRLILLP